MKLTRPSIILTAAFFLTLSGMWSESVQWTPQEAVQRLQQRYEQIDSFSADFTQIYSSRGFEEEESGHLLMKKPGKMYWEYRKPARKLFIADGKKSYFYVPAENQVMESELSLNTADTPLLFLFGEGDILADFEVTYAQEAPRQSKNLLLQLTPRQPHGEFSSVLVEIDPTSLHIRHLAVIEPIGSRHDYILENVKENIRISERRFRFKTPPGAEVIRQ